MHRPFRLPPSRRTVRRDVREEIAFHIEGRIAELMAGGLTRADARAEALRRFGDADGIGASLERLDNGVRERRALRGWLEDLGRDLRLAIHVLRTRRGHTAAILLILALGIGATTAIFSVADALLFRPPAFARPTQLASVWRTVSAGEYAGVVTHTRSFTSIAAWAAQEMNLGDDARTERVDGAEVSANVFATLGVAPAIGRAFSPDADRPGTPREVVLAHDLWESWFNGDSAVLGRSLLVEGVPRTIVGIMPPAFRFPTLATKVLIPGTFDRSTTGNYWGWSKYQLVGRLRVGVTLAQATADVRQAARALRRDNPVWDPGALYGADATVAPLKAARAGPARATLLVLLGVVFVLLLVACANVANLLLVRAIAREREFAVRCALGCGVGRLTRLLLTEHLLLALAGGALGVALAASGVRALVTVLPPQLPRIADITVDGRVLTFAAALSVGCGLLVGLLPALRAALGNPAAGALAPRGGSRGTAHRRLTSALTVAQLSLAAVLITGSGLLLRSLAALERVDPGFSPEHVISARVTLPAATYRDAARQRAFLSALLSRLHEAPGATSVALVSRPPLRDPIYGAAIRVQGQFEDVARSLPVVEHMQNVTPGYFGTMRIALLRGRDFTDADDADAPGVVIVSDAVARRFWPGENAVGQRIGMPYASPWMTVVGVVRDAKLDSLSGSNEEAFYVPLAQQPLTDVTVLARTPADPGGFVQSVRHAVQALDPTVPVSAARSLADVVSGSLARARFTALLLGAFAMLALLLGAVGTYGVVSFVVTQRTRDIGLYMALGATPAALFRQVLARGSMLAAIGLAVGLAASLVVSRALSSLLFGVRATDVVTYSTTGVILFLAALVATWVPARRAVRTDPMSALRRE